MSQENVEIARRACEAAWRRPKPDFDTLNALAHPDHEMFSEDWEASVTETRPVDDERVLVTGWMKARGVRGGVPVEQEFWVVMRVHDGRVIRSAVHTDREQTLEAAGLRE